MKKVNITIDEKSYAVREEIKSFRTNIQFCGDEKRVLLMTSCAPGEGKTTMSIDLARSISDMGKSVILVDADMRKSVMAARLQIEEVPKGLSHFLSGQCTLTEAICATNIPKMHILMSGPTAPNPTELLESKRFQGMVDSMRKIYDYIIIDCPPLGMVIDAAIIARECDGAIMVVEASKTKYRFAQETKMKLERSGVPILGVILNKVDRKRTKGYYNKYYGKSYKGYYINEEKDKKKEKK